MSFHKKYFFFDIDGTLVPVSGGREIPESARRAIDELRSRGHFCAIATGRAQCLAIDMCEALGFDNMVSDGGNGVTLEGKLLGIDPLPRQLCLDLAEQCEQENIPWAVSPDNSITRLTGDQRFADIVGTYYMRTAVVPGLDIRSFPEILKMYVACSPEEEARIPALAKLPRIRYQKEYLFIEPMNKAVGIRRIMDYYHAPYEDVVVFGDALNDLSMFLPEEWTCIAMGNGVPELKERATFVTKDAADDGIAYALKHFGWID